MSLTAKLGFRDFDRQALGVDAFNYVSRVMDGLTHCIIQAIVTLGPQNANPLPEPGQVYIVGSDESDGAWTKHDQDLAIGNELIVQNDINTIIDPNNWVFVTPVEGFVAWKADISRRYTYQNGAWFQGDTIPDLNGESATIVRDRIITLLDDLRGHGVIAT